MKNFFKKLAFVLALAMVVTAIAPAAKASAATSPSFKYDAKKLYLGGDVTGNYGETYRFKFNNAKGYTATWKSSNAKVATVDAKTGNIQAVAVGKATITATLTKKGSDAVELKATVQVKQNAEKIGFGSTASVKDMAVGDTGKVNVYRQVGATKVWKQADKTVSTDVIKWNSSNPEVATVDKWGKVTAVAAGETTITATATQTEGSKAVVAKSYKVTVKAGLLDVKQTASNTADLKFAGDLSAVANKDNVKVFQVVGTTKVSVFVKEVKFDATDKTKATLTTFADFAKDQEYVVEYADSKVSFKGADLSKDAVAEIKITTTEAVKNEPKEIEVKAYNANGVEIPAATVKANITLEAATSSDFYLSTDNKITFFNAGKTATITAVYHTYKYDASYNEIQIKAQAVINSVEKASESIKTVDVFTVYNTAKPDFTKPNTTISVDDNGTYKVAVKATNNFDKEVDSSKFTFESSNSAVLIISGTTLYPVKEGNAVVIVKFGNTIVGAYTVTIGASRAASDVTAQFNKTNLSAGNASDSVTLKVTAKDQFGADVALTSSNLKVEFLNGPANANTVVPATTNNEYVFKGDVYTVEGTYQYKVTVGKQVRYVSFEAKKADVNNIASYQFTENGKTVDTALKVGDANNTDNKAFTMSLASYDKNGYKISNVEIKSITKSTTPGAVFAEISTPENKDASAFISLASGSIVINPVVKNVAGAFEKAPAGTYSVKVFEVNKDGVAVPLTVASFTIADTQTKFDVVKVKDQSAKTTAEAAIADKNDVITIKIGDEFFNEKVTKVVVRGNNVAGNQIYIEKVTVKVPVQYNTVVSYIEQEVVIGQTITLAK